MLVRTARDFSRMHPAKRRVCNSPHVVQNQRAQISAVPQELFYNLVLHLRATGQVDVVQLWAALPNGNQRSLPQCVAGLKMQSLDRAAGIHG